MAEDKKKQLLDFIDKKAFDVVINANPDNMIKTTGKSWKTSNEKPGMKKNSFTKIIKMQKK